MISVITTMNSYILSILALAMLMSCASAHDLPQDDLIRINLVRQKSPTRGELIFSHQFSSVNDTDDSSRFNMIRYKGFNYIGEIQVGQPGKLFRVLLDSGSGDLWLPTVDCSGIDKTIVATYNQRQSNSFKDDGRQVKLMYAGGVSITGYLAREFVRFGDLELQNMTFIQVDKNPRGEILQHFHVDGILGLNFKSGAGYKDVEAPIHQILRTAGQKSNGKGKSILSFSLNHGRDESHAGQMIIGGLDESLYVGWIAWTPLMRSEHWQIRVESIELRHPENEEASYWETTNKDINVCPHGCDAIVDTGAMPIMGSYTDIKALNEKIGAKYVGGIRFALASCKGLDGKLPLLIIKISGREFSLTPSQYTYESNGACYSAFVLRRVDLPHWTIGSMFFGHFYNVLDFDNKRFGLAESPFKSPINVANQ